MNGKILVFVSCDRKKLCFFFTKNTVFFYWRLLTAFEEMGIFLLAPLCRFDEVFFYLFDIIIITCFFLSYRRLTKNHIATTITLARMYNYWHVNNGTTNQRVIFYSVFYPKINESLVCWLLFRLLDFFLVYFFFCTFYYLFWLFNHCLVENNNKKKF